MRKFKTESQRLLDIVINSIYTNREIFLRELISNASDAVDKLYFRSLTDQSVEVRKDDLAIRVSFDKAARTITVSDNGIGMTKDELDKNLGTIAHSGSFEFKTENAESQGEDVDIIGQFGVGFYSAFMVAKQVIVVSRAYGSDEAWSWESDGVQGYTIEAAERDTHGTDVIMVLKDSADPDTATELDGFLSEYGLQDLIRRYSNYVRYPVQMLVTKSRPKPKPVNAPEDAPTEYEDYTELETINSMVPIWKRKKDDVTQEEYNEFYKSEFHDFSDPARTISMHAEGTLTYDALLFIPGRQPYDFYTKEYEKGLALYSSNVLIQEKCAELLPDYFNFVRGIVDSQDLTLNISRETLQHNGQLKAIARRVEKKVKGDLADLRDNDREAYEKFFDNFGRGLKFGLYSTYGQAKDVLADLLLFYSAKEKKLVTLDEYVDAMPEEQDAIYYAVGDSYDRLSQLPIVTTVLGKGFDILLGIDNIDEFCFMSLMEYREKQLKNVAGEDLGLESEEEKQAAEKATEENKGLFEAMKEALGDKVEKVVVSTRLTDAPACVTTEGGVSLKMEKVLQATPHSAEEDAHIRSHRVLEVNVNHAVFEVLKAANAEGDVKKVKLYTGILYDQALLVEDVPLEDPVAFAQAVAQLMV